MGEREKQVHHEANSRYTVAESSGRYLPQTSCAIWYPVLQRNQGIPYERHDGWEREEREEREREEEGGEGGEGRVRRRKEREQREERARAIIQYRNV